MSSITAPPVVDVRPLPVLHGLQELAWADERGSWLELRYYDRDARVYRSQRVLVDPSPAALAEARERLLLGLWRDRL